MSRLTQAVNLAQAFQHREYMSAIYGHSALSMLRAKTRFMYDSNAFQITVGIFICLGFLIDIAESQVMAESAVWTQPDSLRIQAAIATTLREETCLKTCMRVRMRVQMP